MAVGPSSLPEFHSVPGVRIGVVEAGVRYANRKDAVRRSRELSKQTGGVFFIFPINTEVPA